MSYSAISYVLYILEDYHFSHIPQALGFHHHHPILIWFYPRKWGWPNLPHPNSNLSNSHSPSHSIQGILLLQTNTLALLLHLHLPCLLWSSSLLLAFHFKLQCFSQNMPIIPPRHMPVPSHSIRLCHLNHCFLQSQHLN